MSNFSRHRAGATAGLLVAVVLLLAGLGAPAARAAFGFEGISGQLSADASGTIAATQAGSHPFSGSVSFQLNKVTRKNSIEEFVGPSIVPDGSLKTAVTDFPPGLIGNPMATPRCSAAAFESTSNAAGACPDETQIGVAKIVFSSIQTSVQYFRIYNLTPQRGEAARFGARLAGAGEAAVLLLDGSVRTGEAPGAEYGVTLTSAEIESYAPIQNVSVTLWGVPASPAHDGSRGECLDRDEGPTGALCELSKNTELRPFITMPTECTGSPLRTTLSIEPWEAPRAVVSETFTNEINGMPSTVAGCEKLSFNPSITLAPTTTQADSPTGLAVDVHVPQSQEPEGLATAALKSVEVTLPAGMAVNPSSANGLTSCGAAQVELAGPEPASCPDGSKIGTVEIDTPLLEKPLPGNIYLAKQTENKFGSLLAIYLAVDDPQTGVVIKLPGKIETDQSTGRITATFDNAPQLPFEDLHATFFGGPGAALVTPPTCGSYVTTASFTPWSGTAPVRSTSSFDVTSGPNGGACPNGGFDPKLTAGTVNPVAGQYSPFLLKLSREDGTQRLGAVTAVLPKGLLAKLAGIPYCSDAALAAIPGAEGTGAAQLANPSCPAASQVGTVSVGAGAGPAPFFVNTGKVYLAGPYKGAPLSLAIVTPALAGPFDLGNVTVRAALQVNPETTQVTAVSDPLPTILHGIPLDLRSVAVSMNREGFTLNPTNCEASEVGSTITGAGGAVASPSVSFQVANCASLGFKPKLALRLKGSTRRAGNPALTATLTSAGNQANIGRVSVALPHSEFLAQAHIRTVCTRVQFAAGAVPGEMCPPGSIYGTARVFTPLLSQPLEGPVYLRSSSNKLPDLVAALNGQIDIDLDGRIDSVKGGIRTSFEAVPDAPVTKFVLQMRGGKKSLLENSTNLCQATNRATVKMNGQNGRPNDFKPAVVAAGCGGKKGKKG